MVNVLSQGSIMPSPSLPVYATRVNNGIELRVKIVPGARQNGIVGPLGERLKIRVSAPPEDGKANAAVVEVLRQWLNTEAITVVAGLHHPNKTIFIPGLNTLSDLPSSR
jgi:uncharacterized protein